MLVVCSNRIHIYAQYFVSYARPSKICYCVCVFFAAIAGSLRGERSGELSFISVDYDHIEEQYTVSKCNSFVSVAENYAVVEFCNMLYMCADCCPFEWPINVAEFIFIPRPAVEMRLDF